MKVLIADDSALIRRRLAALVAGLDGVSGVLEAGDALSARRLAAAQQPEVVLLDLRLPGAQGLRLLKSLAAVVPAVIVLTGSNGDALHRRCLDAGAHAYFAKESGFLAAIAAVQALLNGGGRNGA